MTKNIEDKKLLAILSKMYITQNEFNYLINSNDIINAEATSIESTSKGKFSCYNIKSVDENSYTIKVKI